MIDFSQIVLGQKYDRPTLATLWGYASHHAIDRGVFTPKNQNIIIFFITNDKQVCLTQYEDHIEQDILFWEGEKAHGSDARIVSRKDEIHVFYRERHHSDFTYEGRAILGTYRIYKDRPSKFSFQLLDRMVDYTEIVAEIKAQYGLAQTEKEAIIKSRIGQGIYRQESIKLWGDCSVTGFTKMDVLIASHIKPWKVSDNSERINPYNSLLLVPTIDKLFDRGYVGFEPDGKILLSDKITDIDWKKINMHRDLKLRIVPEETKKFLQYHCEYKFDLVEN